jgi:hypothetical protein
MLLPVLVRMLHSNGQVPVSSAAAASKLLFELLFDPGCQE